MNYDDEIIKELAEPILEQLEKLQDKIPSNLVQLPDIKFILDPSDEPMVIDGIEITDELIEKLEDYIKEEIEMIAKPTILH